jgi:hypothetical protein
MDLKQLLSTGPKPIRSSIVNEIIYLALDADVDKVAPGCVVYTTSEIAYLIKTEKKAPAIIKAMYGLKKQGVRVILDTWPEAPDTMVWTVLLSLLGNDQKHNLCRLFLALRAARVVRLDRNLRICPALGPGVEEEYTAVRKRFMSNLEDIRSGIKKTYKFISNLFKRYDGKAIKEAVA